MGSEKKKPVELPLVPLEGFRNQRQLAAYLVKIAPLFPNATATLLVIALSLKQEARSAKAAVSIARTAEHAFDHTQRLAMLTFWSMSSAEVVGARMKFQGFDPFMVDRVMQLMREEQDRQAQILSDAINRFVKGALHSGTRLGRGVQAIFGSEGLKNKLIKEIGDDLAQMRRDMKENPAFLKECLLRAKDDYWARAGLIWLLASDSASIWSAVADNNGMRLASAIPSAVASGMLALFGNRYPGILKLALALQAISCVPGMMTIVEPGMNALEQGRIEDAGLLATAGVESVSNALVFVAALAMAAGDKPFIRVQHGGKTHSYSGAQIGVALNAASGIIGFGGLAVGVAADAATALSEKDLSILIGSSALPLLVSTIMDTAGDVFACKAALDGDGDGDVSAEAPKPEQRFIVSGEKHHVSPCGEYVMTLPAIEDTAPGRSPRPVRTQTEKCDAA